MRNVFLARLLLIALCLATLTLWISAYWPVALFEISVLLIAGAAGIVGISPANGTRYPFLALSFIAFWGCFQLTIASTTNRFATERATLQWLTWAAFYYTAVSLLESQNMENSLRKMIAWFGFSFALEAILQAYLSPGTVFGIFPSGYRDFVMGPIVYHTHFAVLIEVILPVSLFLALSETKESYIYLGVSAVLLAAIIVSGSRGGLVIATAEVPCVLLLFHFRKPSASRKTGFLALTLVGVTAALTSIVGFETTSARFYSGALTSGRLQFAISTLRMIAVHPWIGWGLGCWPAVYPAFATFDPGAIVNQAHSDWLQWTAEGGWPVGLAMLSLAVWAIRPAIRSIWGIGVLAVFIHGAFDYPFSRPAIGAWPFLILAMAAVATNSH